MTSTPINNKGAQVNNNKGAQASGQPSGAKRFHTYIGREMYRRLLEFPYMRGSDFHACPPEPRAHFLYSRQQDYKYIHSFLCMIFYQYSDYSMSQLEPTGNSIRGLIHRNGCGTERTLLLFASQVFHYPKRSAPLRMLRLLIRTFGQISLYNLSYRLVDLKDFDLELYKRMVRRCYPDRYVVQDEAEAYRLNHRKRGPRRHADSDKK